MNCNLLTLIQGGLNRASPICRYKGNRKRRRLIQNFRRNRADNHIFRAANLFYFSEVWSPQRVFETLGAETSSKKRDAPPKANGYLLFIDSGGFCLI
jgi:hypothetical protein